MEKEKALSEIESLRLIAATIQEAKGGYYHDSGMGSMLWGSVVGIAGFMTFLQLYFDWSWNFDWWLLALLAIIPQVFIILTERKNQVVKTQVGNALDIVWIVFGICILCIVLYMHITPQMAGTFMEESGFVLIKKNLATGELMDYEFIIAPSPGSLFLLIYALPTMVTGVVQKFKPMIIGALITYLFFVVSLYTKNPIDQLMMGIAGLVNWLIPGLILRSNYLKARNNAHV